MLVKFIQRFQHIYQVRNCGGMEGVSGGVTDEEAACNPEGPEADINGVENAEEYRPGGYHPVALGDVLGGRLVILQMRIMIFLFLFLRPL